GERRRADVPALPVLAVTDDARLLVHLSAGGDVRRPGRRGYLSRHRRARRGRRHRPVEAEQPDAVAARGTDERVAGGKRDHVLLALVLERARRRVHARAGLKFPQLLPRRGVERGEASVVAADEQQPAAGRERAAVALLRPLIAPRNLVRRDVERGDDPGARHARVRRRAAEEARAVLRRRELRIAAARVAADDRGGADEHELLLRVVRTRWPV